MGTFKINSKYEIGTKVRYNNNHVAVITGIRLEETLSSPATTFYRLSTGQGDYWMNEEAITGVL